MEGVLRGLPWATMKTQFDYGCYAGANTLWYESQSGLVDVNSQR